jgi:glycosyltransferase involved in cell wall biosynthesis
LLDQFVVGYYGATALEAMATGLPVVMRLVREQYDALCATGAPPVLHAETADDVAAQLAKLAASPQERDRLAVASRRWIEQNHSVDVWGDRYAALLNAVAAGAPLDFHDSPLRAPLGEDEIAYHAAGLRSAPPFPEYTI